MSANRGSTVYATGSIISYSTNDGIRLFAFSTALVSGSTITYNGSNGVQCGDNSFVDAGDVVVSNNTDTCFYALNGGFIDRDGASGGEELDSTPSVGSLSTDGSYVD